MKKFIILLFIPLLLGAACGISFKTGGDDGGIYKSIDQGETFKQKVFVEQIKKKKIKTIAAANILKLAFNPENSRTIYAGTRADGLWVSYNGAEKWNQIIPKGAIVDIAVDSQDDKLMYVISPTTAARSLDQGAKWEYVYRETTQNVSLNALTPDPKQKGNVYLGTSDGRLLRSADSGTSWQVVQTFRYPITDILINKYQPEIIYVLTSRRGLYLSADRGKTFDEMNEGLKRYRGSLMMSKGIIYSTLNREILIITSQYGLLKTEDGGKNWIALPLLTPPGKASILSLAINPRNPDHIYYGTSDSLYRSFNGGINWVTAALPSKRAAAALLVDPKDSKILYLGVSRIKK